MKRAWTILCTAMLVFAATPLRAADTELAIIVNRERRTNLTRDDVASIFLKKRRFWEDGAPIVALNRESDSAARDTFSRVVLGTSSGRLAAYWNEQYFHGIFPPATLESSAAVKRYVASDRNAIGYVDATEVDDTVHVVLTAP
jgi:ABC-type phosphate transport system substrate-binding protein